MRATLLRRLAGGHLTDVARAVGMSLSGVMRLETVHARVLRSDERHRRLVLSFVRGLLADGVETEADEAGLPLRHDVLRTAAG